MEGRTQEAAAAGFGRERAARMTVAGRPAAVGDEADAVVADAEGPTGGVSASQIVPTLETVPRACDDSRFQRRSLLVALLRLEPTPVRATSIGCGDKLELFRRRHPELAARLR